MPREKTTSQHILITGGTRGIGLACAQELANQGHRLCLVGNTLKSVEYASTHLDTNKHQILKLNLLTSDGIAALLTHLESKFEPDTVIHAIGGIPDFGSDTPEIEKWQSTFALNLFCIVDINKSIITRKLEAGRQAKIIHISSSAAEHGKAKSHYACAKAALNQYIKSEGRTLAKHNISLTGIMPAATIGNQGYWDRQRETNPSKYQKAEAAQTTGKFQNAQEVAKTVAFLCSSSGTLFAGCILPADATI